MKKVLLSVVILFCLGTILTTQSCRPDDLYEIESDSPDHDEEPDEKDPDAIG